MTTASPRHRGLWAASLFGIAALLVAVTAPALLDAAADRLSLVSDPEGGSATLAAVPANLPLFADPAAPADRSAAPDAAKPDAAKPDAAKPDAAKPESGKADASSKPTASRGQPANPAAKPSEKGDAAKAGEPGKPEPRKSGSDTPAGKRKIVLIAGARDNHHPAGTHEYDQTVAAIKSALITSNVADQVTVEAYTTGWPEDESTLDDADTIFLFSSGADRDEQAHPFLVGDRMAVIEKQMQRGCGLMMLHWSLFTPCSHDKQICEWIGGYFDYQRGDDPRGWHSAISFASAEIAPNPQHPISRGVEKFQHRDEYYYEIRFGKKDPRITPIVKIKLPMVEELQTVAWTVERADGGRAFAFTGGHFQKSWNEIPFRRLLLNALCWTAKVKIPPEGVVSKELP